MVIIGSGSGSICDSGNHRRGRPIRPRRRSEVAAAEVIQTICKKSRIIGHTIPLGHFIQLQMAEYTPQSYSCLSGALVRTSQALRDVMAELQSQESPGGSRVWRF